MTNLAPSCDCPNTFKIHLFFKKSHQLTALPLAHFQSRLSDISSLFNSCRPQAFQCFIWGFLHNIQAILQEYCNGSTGMLSTCNVTCTCCMLNEFKPSTDISRCHTVYIFPHSWPDVMKSPRRGGSWWTICFRNIGFLWWSGIWSQNVSLVK